MGSHILDLCAATLSVPEGRLDELAAIYGAVLGLAVQWSGVLDSDLTASWGIAAQARSARVLGAPGESRGLIRLVAGAAAAPPPLATFGWSVLELTVHDVDQLHDVVRASPHFRVNGEPQDLRFSTDPPGQRAMQAVGPSGEQLYLTQVLRQTVGRELAVPPEGCSVGAVFIAVLAARDYAAARRFYVEGLGMQPSIELDQVKLSVATREARWPPGIRIPLVALKPRGETRIELDGYPGIAWPRGVVEGELPGGFGLASFAVADLEAALAAVAGLGCEPLGGVVRCDIPPYEGRRAVTVYGGDGELVELIGP